ncbi:hypothetical protein HDV57DRAFT_376677 [Trichoderma longibrachiatum]|uniref:Uncharacterized protein n=1 Tax=Trichoderma longibrachiatum ATCC 18648 TaxID=983965 RepID=A0A2T4BQE2_TRILO|nr:hypothetical protein M440DRAFT_1147545 [Trichoderma longibrachiatum ATCC 18648]
MVCHPHETERFAKSDYKGGKSVGQADNQTEPLPPSINSFAWQDSGRDGPCKSETRIGDRKITQDKCKAGGPNTLLSSTFVWTISRQITERDSQFVGKIKKRRRRGDRGVQAGTRRGWPGPDLVPEPYPSSLLARMGSDPAPRSRLKGEVEGRGN